MTPSFLVADLHSQAELRRVAYSAMPDAPVLPYVERTRRVRRIRATLPKRFRRPVFAIVSTGHHQECEST